MAGQIDKDLRWIPLIAPHLPLATPRPVTKGRATVEYPCDWGVYTWLPGETADIDLVDDPVLAAFDVAAFLAALRGIETAGAPPAGPPETSRGVPVRTRDAEMRDAIGRSAGEVDVEAVTAVWESVLDTPDWGGPPTWIHGDLIPGNMLVHERRLSAILDFSALCVGDPANDVMVAWTFLTAEGRTAFRAELGVDDATWARGRGWALSWALIALPYYLDTNPDIVGWSRRTIAEALAEG